MNRYVIDASVAVKWYSRANEEESAKADRLLDLYGQGDVDLVAPSLICYELGNALRYNPNFSVQDVKRAMGDFLQLQIVLEPPAGHLDSAIDLAFRYSLTVYDAVYAAVSSSLGIPLITADYKFCAKLKDLPLIAALKDFIL